MAPATRRDSLQVLRQKLTSMGVPWSVSMGPNELVLRLECETKRRSGEIKTGCEFLDDMRALRPTKRTRGTDHGVQTSFASTSSASSLHSKPSTVTTRQSGGASNAYTENTRAASVPPPEPSAMDEVMAQRRAFCTKLRENPLYAVHQFPINSGLPFSRVAITTNKIFNTAVQDSRVTFEPLQQAVNESVAALQAQMQASTTSATGQMSPDETYVQKWDARETGYNNMKARAAAGLNF